MIRKIRDKEVRSFLTEEVISFKRKVAEVLGIMSRDSAQNMDNLLIAQLNDVAYKAIKKTGMQKKLDERAVKNEKVMKSMEQQLNTAHAKMDFAKIESE